LQKAESLVMPNHFLANG